MPHIAPFGSWTSPISADLAASTAVSFTGLAVEGRDLYWLESKPSEAGRYAIMHRPQGGPIVERTRPDFSARSTVHEYGGGALAVSDRILYFVNYSDQRIYRQAPDQAPVPLTPSAAFRYADMIVDRQRQRLVCVREDHSRPGEPVNSIVAQDLSGEGDAPVLASGNDFYSNPRLSPDGRKLAYLTWNHPNMPWDGCELWVADVKSDGTLGRASLVAGGRSESVFQPEWSPGGVLHFVAEHTGWWNLYCWRDGAIQPLCPAQAEFGRPMWLFGFSTYGFASEERLLCCLTEQGLDRLAWLDSNSGTLTPIDAPCTDIEFLRCGDGVAAFVGGSPSKPASVMQLDFASGQVESIRPAFTPHIDAAYFSSPESLQFPTTGQRQAHALYYAPRNPDYAAPQTERPPLIVISHGGPTSSASTTLRYGIQYWTSRGFAVIDVNYGGSTGYGREYRRRLLGQWGVVDVDDCCSAALYLADRGLVDRDRLAIRGGSAGGYTTFACLAFRSEVFGAGSAHFGVADLEIFTKDTHKFEAHYLESLVGPYPEKRDLYVARSPVHFTSQFRCALILFQGDEDKIVPPSQSRMMFDAARLRGLPTAYMLFQGEQHGFRKAESLKRALEAEFFFFSRIFRFELREPIPPISIENLSPMT